MVTGAESRGPRLAVWLAAAAIGAAALAAYSNSFSVPFLYDDTPTIADNPSIRHWATALLPPNDTTAGGRPVLNLSLALNYALGGTSVWGYHAVNLAIHLAAGLVLFGVLRRSLRGRPGSDAVLVAASAALLWTVHPLQTEAVTYVVQRAESLMGLLYLLTLYAFIRSTGSPTRSAAWSALCIVCCALGMGTKEVMVSAPLIVLLYDRTFISGSFGRALRNRPWLHASLAATWIPLVMLVVSSHGRGGTAGTGAGVTPLGYALTQVGAVVHYVRLAAWPHPLVFDYGTDLATPGPGLLLRAILLGAALAAAVWAVVRRPEIGFLGAWFFAVIAPSSSVVPVATEVMAEHRMYLPLAALVVMAVVLLHRVAARATLPVSLALAAGFAALTFHRNQAYASAVSIWADTAREHPSNERAHANLGAAWLGVPGHLGDAVAEYQEAERLKPGDAEVRNDLGTLYLGMPGRTNDAVAEYQEAVRLRPGFVDARNNLGASLVNVPGRLADAVAELREVARESPGDPDAHNSLGYALSKSPGRSGEAVAELEEALRLRPDFAMAHANLGLVLSAIPGRTGDAVAHFERALSLNPSDADTHFNLANALMGSPGRLRDAVREYGEALRLNPNNARVHNNLGYALSQASGGSEEAIAHYREALRLSPDYATAHLNLGFALAALPDRRSEAISEFEAVLRLKPDNAEARRLLGELRGDPR
jgi:Flp pilus assembly protein TadD